jgi:hypothetical protein
MLGSGSGIGKIGLEKHPLIRKQKKTATTPRLFEIHPPIDLPLFIQRLSRRLG